MAAIITIIIFNYIFLTTIIALKLASIRLVRLELASWSSNKGSLTNIIVVFYIIL